ncbi:MAG: bifunctional nuclease family protein [Candidatus Rokubacteria bacterium]|nr:bifunctional nuclease family protein [Candidatus Rokubacteria bacterium]
MSTSGRIAMIALLTVALTGVTSRGGSGQDRGGGAAPRADGPQETQVVAAYVDPGTQSPVVILRGMRDKRTFPMSIGPAELGAIAITLNGVTPPRPLTHDLFLTLFGRFNVKLTRVVITDLRDDVYYATLHLTNGTGEITLDSRPSDAIALAIRAKVPVFVESRVFDKAGKSPAPPARPHI